MTTTGIDLAHEAHVNELRLSTSSLWKPDGEGVLPPFRTISTCLVFINSIEPSEYRSTALFHGLRAAADGDNRSVKAALRVLQASVSTLGSDATPSDFAESHFQCVAMLGAAARYAIVTTLGIEEDDLLQFESEPRRRIRDRLLSVVKA